MDKNVRLVFAALCVIIIAAVVAGCGSSGGSSSSTAPKSEEAGSTSEEASAEGDGVAEAKKFVAEHSDFNNLEWPKPPDEPFDPGHKRAAVITCAVEGEGCHRTGEETVEAVKAAGWTVGELGDGQFTPSVQAGLVQKAIAEKVDGIVIVEISLASIKGAVDAAYEAGIPITCVTCSPSPGFESVGLKAKIPATDSNQKPAGELVGNYIVANSGEEASVMAINDPAFQLVIERTEGLQKVLTELCPKCSFEEISIDTKEITEPGPPFFTGWLAAHPEGTDWIMATDAEAIPMLKTFEERGLETKMAGIDAEPTNLENMVNGGPVAVDVYSPFAYSAWAGVDLMLRESAGAKLWDASTMPFALVTKETAPEILAVAPKLFAPSSFNYKEMFQKLWGTK